MSARQENKGITLIALIITIIVMLILVAVSLQIAMQSGLFDSAGKATQKWKTEQEKEADLKVNIAGMEYDSVDKYVDSLTVQIPWIYKENENGEIEITGLDVRGYSYTDGSNENYRTYLELGTDTLIIPDQLEGKNVVKVTLSDSLKPLDSDSKNYIVAKDIENIVIGNNVTEINFYHSMFDEGSVFRNATSISIPNSLTTIGDHCFRFNNSLVELDWSNSRIQSIGDYAFYYCSELQEISLPNTINSIGRKAFKPVPVVNFPNGMNETLRANIPNDLWGAEKITIEGVEYVPET